MTWAGQEALTVRERKSKLIFLLHKLTTEITHSPSGLFLSLYQTIVLHVTYKLAFWLTDSKNRIQESRGVIKPLHKRLTEESLLFPIPIQLCRNLATEGWSIRGEAETPGHFCVGQQTPWKSFSLNIF